MNGAQGPNGRPNIPDAEHGRIPWPLEEFLDVLKWFGTVLTTPMDEWRKPELTFRMEDPETGEEEEYRLNFLKLEVQLMHHVITKYPGLQSEVAFAYTLRFMRIQRFLAEHKQRLIECGLIRPGPTHSETSNLLFDALCKLPFTEERTGEDGQSEFHFSYKDVMAEAERLASQEDE